MVTSKIQETVQEIFQFVEDDGKMTAFSSTRVSLQKDRLYELLEELEHQIPDEVKRYQKVINNRDGIIKDAEAKAKLILEDAKKEKENIVSGSDIVREAYAKANEIVSEASKQAEKMLMDARNDSDQIRTGALAYTEDMLDSLENLIGSAYETTNKQFASLSDNLGQYLNTVIANKKELGLQPPSEDDTYNPYPEDSGFEEA